MHAESEERFRGLLKCIRKQCQQRWLVEPLVAGNVRWQLTDNYQDAAIADDIMRRFTLPEEIPAPMYLQMPLNTELWSGYIKDKHLPFRERRQRLVQLIMHRLHTRAL